MEITFEDLADEYKSELTDSFGFFTVGYYSLTAGQILENCRPDEFKSHALAFAKQRGYVVTDLEVN